jgi:hypothetical protein|tara:strand:- start:809 stop:1987 length:1179 start_codon:yes stop_codon:yes gene_type:complete
MDSNQYRVNKANAYNGWDPLKQIVLGNTFTPEFFEDIGDPKLRDLLQQILYETHEDLDGIQKTLEDMGVDVVRMPANNINPLGTARDTYSSFTEFAASNEDSAGKVRGIPKSCLTPRDDFLTLGNKILYTNHMWFDHVDHSNEIFNPEVLDLVFQDAIEKHRAAEKSGIILEAPLKPTGKSECFEDHKWGFWAPAVHRVGNRLIIDEEDWSNLSEFLLNRYPEFEAANVAIGGHNDSSMNLPKPGLVVCGNWMSAKDFEHTLPGWDVVPIEYPDTMVGEGGLPWNDDKMITQGRWWTPEAKSNPELVSYVDKWLHQWVGFAEETVFEINMLAVNPEVTLSLNYQPEVHNALAKHGVEAVYCRFRHRNFWDGGLHCITLDTYREGGMQDYFAK